MKRISLIVFVGVFALLNALSFISCSSAEARVNSKSRFDTEVRACWVSSIGNLDFPSKTGMTNQELRGEIDAIIMNCKNIGLNTIFFQVRPNGDALYRSEVFPWSKYLSGKQGVAPEQAFDPLTYFVQKAHKNNIKLHAWINPYRIGTGENVEKTLSADNPAVLHPEYTVESDSGLYYNPGLPEVRALILDGIRELICNYEIDGIHFDDYFYPYDMKGFDDSDAYKKYGNGRSLSDFRRNCVNELVRLAYTLIKSQDPNKEFGISPFGIWANKSTHPEGSNTSGMSSYAAIFSDSKKWVEQGWVDYICPQVYWSFDHRAAPFAEVVDWWESVCKNTDVKLYIGMAAYKINTDEIGWDQANQISNQLQYASKKSSYAGHCFFRYGVLMENPLDVLGSIKEYYGENIQTGEQTEVIPPLEFQVNTTLQIHSPVNKLEVEGSKISVSGVTIPGQSVTVNGIKAIVSDQGYFSAYIPLKDGLNKLTARSAGMEKTVYVSKKTATEKKTKFDLDSFYPNGNLTYIGGEVVCFSVEAPQDSEIVLTNGCLTIPFDANKENDEEYIAYWSVPALSISDKLVLKDFVFQVKDQQGKTTSIPAKLSLNLSASENQKIQYLKKDAFIFNKSSGGSQMDHQPLAQGSGVTPLAEEGTRVLLENGYWMEKEVLSDEPISPKEPANYDYEVVTIFAKNPIMYTAYVDDNSLNIQVKNGRNIPIKAESDTMKLALEQEFNESDSLLRISSKAGYDLAGYEIYPQEEQIMVYLRIHSNKLRGKTILLDAGHGGADSGALGPGGAEAPTESELNLLLTQYLKRELEAVGANVLLTRAGDSALSLEERVEKSMESAPDLFISLHHNSTVQTADFNEVSGGLVLYSSPLSQNLADCLAKNLWAGIRENPEVPSRRQSLHVCRQTRCPSVLIEAGYLCNPMEYELLCRTDNAEKIAKNIVIGLKEYFVSVCF